MMYEYTEQHTTLIRHTHILFCTKRNNTIIVNTNQIKRK